MIKKIKKPDFVAMWAQSSSTSMKSVYDKWFEENVEPINKAIDDAEVVYGWGKGYDWYPSQTIYKKNVTQPHHKALLINIEPIKQKTREEKLEEFVEAFLAEQSSRSYEKGEAMYILKQRARVLLNEEE